MWGGDTLKKFLIFANICALMFLLEKLENCELDFRLREQSLTVLFYSSLLRLIGCITLQLPPLNKNLVHEKLGMNYSLFRQFSMSFRLVLFPVFCLGPPLDNRTSPSPPNSISSSPLPTSYTLKFCEPTRSGSADTFILTIFGSGAGLICG